MKISRTVVITCGLAMCVALAFAIHPSALFPAPLHASTSLALSPLSQAPHQGIARTHEPPTLVYVAGAVVRPGVYAVPADARASDALARAGGAKADADMIAVNLAAHVTDGEEIAVPRIGDGTRVNRARIPRAAAGTHRASHRRSTRRAVASPAPNTMVDVNTAGETDLAELPGIGPSLAARIIAFRAANGRFSSIDELADISGITSSRLDKILPFVTVGAAAP